ncbi:DUF3854 domain-containing protein [Bacillus swezeyi]|nr:DUF3854 domain-containing protein [Bacillus swezeyi]
MQHKDGNRIACIRVESKTVFSKNKGLDSYLHFLKEKSAIKIDHELPDTYQEQQKQSNQALNYIYSELLICLSLSEEHKKHLCSENRGLSLEQIKIRGYKSFPEKPWVVVSNLSKKTGITDFTGIPGFFLAEGRNNKYWTLSGYPGILIPYRNFKNEIIGMQYRIDSPQNTVQVKVRKYGLMAKVIEQPNKVQVSFEGEILWEKKMNLNEQCTVMYEGHPVGWVTLKQGNRYFWLSSANKPNGCASGNPAPIHVSVPSQELKTWQPGDGLKKKTVWVTEGGLKADIAVDLMKKLYTPLEIKDLGTTMLALPGANAWNLIFPLLKQLQVECVNICLDADAASNPHVKKYLLEFVKKLKEENYKANLVIWSESDSKGIDDLFLKNKRPQIKKLF